MSMIHSDSHVKTEQKNVNVITTIVTIVIGIAGLLAHARKGKRLFGVTVH